MRRSYVTPNISIKIEAAHVSYKSGFLENIKQIVVSSNVSFDLGNQKVQALTVNRTWQKTGNKSDDDIAVNDLLAVLSPASPSSISIKMQFSGIGQDRFKEIYFDLLSSADVKTVLNMSPATLAETNLGTSIAQKFLATPYTSNNPKDVLSMSQGFVIYPDRLADRVDSLRQGYLVVISGTENKSADLNNIPAPGSDALRFDSGSHLLQIKQANGSWRAFLGNSYLVLSVTVDSVRGTDENSPWFKKFADADKTTENLLTGDTLDKVKKDAMALWQEGSTLLSADANYIETERKSIRLRALADVQTDLQKNGAPPSDASLANAAPGVPANLAEVAKNYEAQLQQANVNGRVAAQVLDSSGKPASNVPITVQNVNTGKTLLATTDAVGRAVINSLNSGSYIIRANKPGSSVVQTGSITVQPRMTKQIQLTIKP